MRAPMCDIVIRNSSRRSGSGALRFLLPGERCPQRSAGATRGTAVCRTNALRRNSSNGIRIAYSCCGLAFWRLASQTGRSRRETNKHHAGGCMKILVAGGAGFVGSHLCARLIQLGHSVYCLDNLMTGRRQNIAPLVSSPRFSFIERSVLDAVWLPVDVIFNLASPASPPVYQAEPEMTLRTNVEGTLRLLQLAKDTDSHFVYASSSEVYGNPSQHPQQEDYLGNVKTMGPRACYDEGKRCAETVCYLYGNRGVRVSVIRIFNTYGPRMRMDDGRVVSNLMIQALRDEALTIYGDGSQTRSFCYVDDLVDGFVQLVNRKEPLPGPLNLGNPEEITVLHLAKSILKLTGSKSRIDYRPLPVDDPVRRCPDIALARRLLNWSPSTRLQEGLARTMPYFSRLVNEREVTPLESAAVAG
jgi:UDP-glucuronate decarboxylase